MGETLQPRKSPRQHSSKTSSTTTPEGHIPKGKDVVDRAVSRRHTSAIKARSASSPPGSPRDGARYSESQSGSSDDEQACGAPITLHQDEDGNISNVSLHSTEHENILRIRDANITLASKKVSPAHRTVYRRKNSETNVMTIVGISSALICFVVLLCCSVIVGPALYKKAVVPKSLGDVEGDIRRDLDKLRSETKQKLPFWQSVYSVLLDTMVEDTPRQPAVLLVAVPLDSRRTAVCLVHHISDIVTKAFQGSAPVVRHHTKDHLSLPHNQHKLLLDDTLQHLSAARAAVVYNMELLPAKVATMLHGYCDNDNAPYKRAAFLLLLELDVPYANVSALHLDEVVERKLHSLWRGDLLPDHIPSLVARVAPQPVLVSPESGVVLDALCPV